MANDTNEEKAKLYCDESTAAAAMWVRAFELKAAHVVGASLNDFAMCRDFADAAIVAAYERGRHFMAS